MPGDLEDAELFAGPGGWDVAAQLLGIRAKGLEWDKAACSTAIAAGHIRMLDAEGKGLDVSAADPPALFPGGIRLLIASPPCQAFSSAGKGLGRKGAAFILMGIQLIAWGNDPAQVIKWVDEQLEDDRAALVLEPLRWILAAHPEMVAMEQVATVLPLWEAYAEVLRNLGYSVWTGNLQAEQYDVPQTRKRAFLIASRTHEVSAPAPMRRKYRKDRKTGEHNRYKKFLADDPGLKPWISMSDALGFGMTQRPSVSVVTVVGGGYPLDGGSGALRTVQSAKDSGDWQEKAFGLTQRPSYTICAGGTDTGGPEPFGNGARQQMRKAIEEGKWCWLGSSNGQQYHPRSDATRITVQEAAIIQGFPADYPWQGNKGEQHRQVGDAVPPPLAWHVLRAVLGLPSQHYPGTENL